MKIEKNFIKQGNIAEFADYHGLTMVINERSVTTNDPMRFYAKFENCSLKGDGVLIGVFGNGSTPESAVDDYADKINLKTLILNGNSKDEKPIKVWRLF